MGQGQRLILCHEVQLAELGGSKRTPVQVALNGYTYRTSVAVMGGRVLGPVSSEVREFFDTLSYSRRQRFVLPIAQAKTLETRQRRLDKTVTALKERKKEP